MYQAIVGKYVSNVHGAARIRVRCMLRYNGEVKVRTLTVSWDYELNADQNYDAAARAFALKYDLNGAWIAGTLPNGDTVHVRLPNGLGIKGAQGFEV